MKSTGRAEPGTWVEVGREVLAAGERAPQVPEDTARVPLEMRARGFLEQAAALGEPAVIVTAAGRRIRGTLVAIEPAYTHGFGAPVPELAPVGGELRALLAASKAARKRAP